VLAGTVSISGNPKEGETLNAVISLNGSGIISYQWKADGGDIGTNALSYVLTAAEVGKTITVTVKRADCTGSLTSLPSAAVSAIGGGENNDPRTLVIANLPSTEYGYSSDGGQIGIFPVGTSPLDALAMDGVIAGPDMGQVIIDGSGPYTITMPLYDASTYDRWTGSGTFDIFIALFGSGGHYYKVGSVTFSSAITTVLFSNVTQVYPYSGVPDNTRYKYLKVTVSSNSGANYHEIPSNSDSNIGPDTDDNSRMIEDVGNIAHTREVWFAMMYYRYIADGCIPEVDGDSIIIRGFPNSYYRVKYTLHTLLSD
jgi:hypothetical protein